MTTDEPQAKASSGSPTSPCFVPLFKIGGEFSELPFEQHGTGILVLFRNHPLLVTAAHVVAEATNGIGVILANDRKTIVSSVFRKEENQHVRVVEIPSGGKLGIIPPDWFAINPIPPGKTRLEDFVDVAAFWLDAEAASRIWFGDLRFITVPEIPDCDLKSDTLLRFAGFPGDPDRNPGKPFYTDNGAFLNLRPWAQEARLLSRDKFPDGFGHEDFPAASCFVAKHKDRFPVTKPGGMSGGPVVLDKEPYPILVGVSTNWREEGYFLGTKLSAVGDVLERAVKAET